MRSDCSSTHQQIIMKTCSVSSPFSGDATRRGSDRLPSLDRIDNHAAVNYWAIPCYPLKLLQFLLLRNQKKEFIKIKHLYSKSPLHTIGANLSTVRNYCKRWHNKVPTTKAKLPSWLELTCSYSPWRFRFSSSRSFAARTHLSSWPCRLSTLSSAWNFILFQIIAEKLAASRLLKQLKFFWQ